MPRTEVSRRTRREEVVLVDEADNPTLAPRRLNSFYYFAYGHNMWIDEMKHCITPKARLVGVAYLPNYKFFLTTRHRANIIEATQEERDTLPKHQRRVYGLVWEVPWGDNDHLRRNMDFSREEDLARLNTDISERLDLMEGARLNANFKRAKSSHYKSEAATVTLVTVPEVDGERRRYIDAVGGYPQGEITCRIYRDPSRVKPYNIILPHFRLIMNMGFADFLNLYHEKRYVDNLRSLIPVFLPDKLWPVMNRDYYKLLEQMSEMLDKNDTFDFDDRRSSIYQQPNQNERDEAATVSSRGRVGNEPEIEDDQTESNYTRTEARSRRSEVSRAKTSRHGHGRRGRHDHDDDDNDDYDDDDDQSSVRRNGRDHDDDDQTELSRRTRRTRVTRRSHRDDDDDEEDDDYYSRAQSSRRGRRADDHDDEDEDDYDDGRTERTARTRGTERRDRRGRDDDGRTRRVTARSTASRAPTAASSGSSEYELILAEVGGKGGRGADRRSTRPRRMPVLDEYSELDEEESLLMIKQQDVRLQTVDIRGLPSRPRRDPGRRGPRSDPGSVYPDPRSSNKIVISYK